MTLVSFVIVFPILLLFFLAVVDFSRVLLVKALLTKGAENGLNIATKVPNLDVDINALPPSDIQYQRYLQARQLVIGTAENLPLGTFITDSSTPSAAQLVSYTYNDPAAGGTVAVTSNVALLRPGEKIQVNQNGTTFWLNHKTYPPPSSGTPVQPPDVLLQSEPVYVEMRAKVHPFLPFLGDLIVVGSALGWRGAIPRGPILTMAGPDAGTTTTLASSSTTTTILYSGTTTTTLGMTCTPNWNVCMTTFQWYCPDPNTASTGTCGCSPCRNVSALHTDPF